MFTHASAPVEVRDLTHLCCTDKDCLSARKCHFVFAGLECIDACSCTNCGNQNNKPERDDGMEVDTYMLLHKWGLRFTSWVVFGMLRVG